MVELQGGGECVVAAVLATTPSQNDHLGFPLTATILQRPVALLVLPATPVVDEFLRQADPGRILRSVVRPEWRAFEAEAAPVEVPELSVDDLARREGQAAKLARLLPDGPLDTLAWPAQRSMRETLKAPLSTPDVQACPAQVNNHRKVGTTIHTGLH